MNEVPTWRLCKEDGTIAEAEMEEWSWVALYEDGTNLKQFGDDGQYHQSKEINPEGLLALTMINNSGTHQPVTIHWRPGLKPLHKYSCRIVTGMDGQEIERIRIYCFGFEEFGIEYWTMITPSDGVIITNSPDKVRLY